MGQELSFRGSSRVRGQLLQKSRLLAFAVYFLVLLGVAKYLNGSFWPPFGLEGIWFYSAAASLLVGELVLEPYFTRPVDALASALAVLIVAATASWQQSPALSATVDGIRVLLVLYAVVVIVTATAAMTLKDSAGAPGGIARTAASFVGRFGRAQWLFGALVFASGYAAFAGSSSKVAALYLSWFIVAVFTPVEWVMALLSRRRTQTKLQFGIVESVQDPCTAIVRFPLGTKPELGERVEIPTANNAGTIVDVTALAPEPIARVALEKALPLSLGSSVMLTAACDTSPIVGNVADGTALDSLVLETVPAAAQFGLQEGRLVEVQVGATPTLYQVVGGHVVRQSERDMVRHRVVVNGRKLGSWNETKGQFDSVPWIANPGSPARLMASRPARGLRTEAIGVVPGTDYGIRIDTHLAVTHNTAILGILGIGKTCLAWELIKRTLAAGIRVVVLDITGGYGPEFVDIFPAAVEEAVHASIEQRIQANVATDTVRSGQAGNFDDFKEAIGTTLDAFLAGDARLLVLNPDRFNVTRMEGKPFNGKANLLASVTMVEATRLIAEGLLARLQAMPREPQENLARVCLVLEEAHSLIPEWTSATNDGDRQAVNGTARAILQGRKYGLGCLLITQRTANVTKTILNQCNTIFAMRVYDATGIEFLQNYLGATYASLLASLRERQAIVFGKASSCNAPVVVDLNDAAEFNDAFWEPAAPGIPAAHVPDEGGSDSGAVSDPVARDRDSWDDIPF